MTHDVTVFGDAKYPRYLQIIPKEHKVQTTVITDITGKEKEIKYRESQSGLIDVVCLDDNLIEVGDKIKMNFNLVEITNIIESRPAIGNYKYDNVIWMRLEFKRAE